MKAKVVNFQRSIGIAEGNDAGDVKALFSMSIDSIVEDAHNRGATVAWDSLELTTDVVETRTFSESNPTVVKALYLNVSGLAILEGSDE